MLNVNFEDLVGKHVFDGTKDFIIARKRGSGIVVSETAYNEETEDFDLTGAEFLMTKAEVEKACKSDLYNGQNVNIIMGAED